MEAMLGQTSKVMLDTKSGNSLMYLPLDKLIQNRATSGSEQSSDASSNSSQSSSRSAPTNLRNVDRTRGSR